MDAGADKLFGGTKAGDLIGKVSDEQANKKTGFVGASLSG